MDLPQYTTHSESTVSRQEGAARFIKNILTPTEIIRFAPQQLVTEGKTLVVIDEEHQKVKRTGEELKHRWVQVYTVENNLITQMEEFATTEVVKEPKSH